MEKRNMIAGLLFGAMIGVIVSACGGSSADNGADGLTQAEVEALIASALAPYEQRIEALEAAVPRVTSGGAAVAAKGGMGQQATALALADFCKLLGHLPSGPVRESDTIECMTMTGFYYNLSYPDGGLPKELSTHYEAANCTGTAYVTSTPELSNGFTNGTGLRGHSDGVVFSYGDAVDSSQVGYTPPNPTTLTRTISSQWSSQRDPGVPECAVFDTPVVINGLVEVIPNNCTGDHTLCTTYLPDAGVPGPLDTQ